MILKADGYNYHRFYGWRLIALLIVFAAYTLWFTGPGPFGQLARLERYDFLESGFLTLVMMTASATLGSFAGVFTLLKYAFFLPLCSLTVGLGVAGVAAGLLRKRKG